MKLNGHRKQLSSFGLSLTPVSIYLQFSRDSQIHKIRLLKRESEKLDQISLLIFECAACHRIEGDKGLALLAT